MTAPTAVPRYVVRGAAVAAGLAAVLVVVPVPAAAADPSDPSDTSPGSSSSTSTSSSAPSGAPSSTPSSTPSSAPSSAPSGAGPGGRALPPPRVLTLQPRIVDLQPRVRDLKPKDRRGEYVVDADVLFAFDRSDLGPDARAVLADVVDGLRRKPGGTVVVSGYTDAYGSDTYNLALSRRRATAVVRYLKAHVGNARLHYRAVGYGESHPTASNDTSEGRRKNRRVTVSH